MPNRKTSRPAGEQKIIDVLGGSGFDDTEPAPVTVDVAPARVVANTRPVPDSELTPDQRRIRDLEHQLALERGKKDTEPELAAPPQPGDGNILIHFVEDGITALGVVWYRGQELEFEPGSPAYLDTCDRNGRSWLALADDESAQIDRWGKVKFRRGPWPGKTLLDAAGVPYENLRSVAEGGPAVTGPSPEELERAAKVEQSRRRAAPRLKVA